MIYWIGGSPCSGKTTISTNLANRVGMDVYRCDDAYYEHLELINPTDQPVLHRLKTGNCDQIWLRPVEQQIAEELEIYREEFPFILNDLAARAQDRPLMLEGAALLPELLAAHGVDRHQCIWIIPTEEFQREHYERREWRHDVVKDCSNPEQAWHNWMSRDAGFARAVRTSAEFLAFKVIVVDGSIPVSENERTVATHFGLI